MPIILLITKARKSRLFSLTVKQRKCNDISDLGTFSSLNWMYHISKVSKTEQRFLLLCKLYKKTRGFLEKFTQLAKILQDRRSRRSWQISTLLTARDTYLNMRQQFLAVTPVVLPCSRFFSDTCFLLNGKICTKCLQFQHKQLKEPRNWAKTCSASCGGCWAVQQQLGTSPCLGSRSRSALHFLFKQQDIALWDMVNSST